MVNGELGTYSMSVYAEYGMLSLWPNIVNSSDRKLTNTLYRHMYIYKLNEDSEYTFEWLICIIKIS